MTIGIHRVTSSSEAGRRMISSGQTHEPWRISKEIREWNARVEERKLEVAAVKQAKKAAEFKDSFAAFLERQCKT